MNGSEHAFINVIGYLGDVKTEVEILRRTTAQRDTTSIVSAI